MDATLAKAKRTLRTARLAFDDGDFDGACNRAYYAMFYAARAGLLAVGQVDAAVGKTHSGMIAAVGRHLVAPGHLPVRLSSALGRESKRRMVIDYQGDGATREDAMAALEAAADFLVAVGVLINKHGDE